MAALSGIRVKGLDKHLTDNDLKLYFRNPRHGGGHISKIYYPLLDNDAVILFKDANIVHNILSISEHLLRGSHMVLSRLPPMVFTLIEAKLEPDIASIVLGSEISNELQYLADVEICSHKGDTCCSLKGDWYQIERAWQIIHKAMGRQEKIQYRLQRQFSSDDGKSRARYRPQGKSTDLDDESDDSIDETSSKPNPIKYSSGRKLQDSRFSDVSDNVTDSIISATPFEDEIFEEVRRKQQNSSSATTKSHHLQDDSDDMYTSHRYTQQRVGKNKLKSDSNKGGHSSSRSGSNKGDHSNYSLADRETSSGHRDLPSPSDKSITHDYSTNYSSLRGTDYDHLFPKVDIVSSNQPTQTKSSHLEGRGSKTYTVTKTPTRSMLDEVQMHSDDSETEVMSLTPYQQHRLKDQNDTFKHFSQMSLTENSDSAERNSSEGFSMRRGSNDSETQVMKVHSSGENSRLKQTHNGTGTYSRDTESTRSRGMFDGDRRYTSLPVEALHHGISNGTTPELSGSRTSGPRLSDEYEKPYGATAPSLDLELEKAISASLKSNGHAEDYPVVDSFEFYVGRIKVLLKRGNITDVKTSGIANAANGYLAHGAGIAGAIAMAAGAGMQQECEELKRKYGALETTTVVHTQAGGKLNHEVSYILHAVGPIWIEAIKGRCTFELIRTYLNCFHYAEKIWLDSISMPCISAGIFGCPLDVSIQSFLDGLLLFHSESGESCHLREVHLVNNDLDGVVTSIVLIKSLLESGQDSAMAQALDRYGKLSKTHGGAIRETKTLRSHSKLISKDDDIIKTKTSADSKRLPARRSSSLQRTDRKSTGVSGFGSSSSRSVIGASNSRLTNDDRLAESNSRQSLRDKTTPRGRSEEKSYTRPGDLPSSSGRLETPRSSSSRSQYPGNDSSDNRPRSGSASKKKVSEQILASQSSSTSSPTTGSQRATPQLKQALVNSSNGARPKQSSVRAGKSSPVKATTLRSDSSSIYGDGNSRSSYGRSYDRNSYVDGSKSLPMNASSSQLSSSSRLRGNSPRRY
ncbi:serine-rich adhesin for platelets-like [Argopecten irradians]|uniref:serine-rich adhesin for platelets-like n=1 Tax=Argopecten irradians TaxID=31199 RepID=UPI0037185311